MATGLSAIASNRLPVIGDAFGAVIEAGPVMVILGQAAIAVMIRGSSLE
jgi:hypothetical protein